MDHPVGDDRPVETSLPNLAEASLTEVLERRDGALARAIRRVHKKLDRGDFVDDEDAEDDYPGIAGFNNWVG